MKISELVAALEKNKAEHGDIAVIWQSILHTWQVDEIRTTMGTDSDGMPVKVLLINP